MSIQYTIPTYYIPKQNIYSIYKKKTLGPKVYLIVNH